MASPVLSRRRETLGRDEVSLEQRIRVPVSGGVLGDTKEATTSALVCSVSKVCIVCTFHQPGSQLRVCCKPRANVWNSALRRIDAVKYPVASSGVLGCCKPAQAGHLLSLLAAPTIHRSRANNCGIGERCCGPLSCTKWV